MSFNKIIPILIFQFVISQVLGFQPTRNVSVSIKDKKFSPSRIHFICPFIRPEDDLIRYYKHEENNLVFIKEQNTSDGIIIKLKQLKDLGKYECSVISKDKTVRNATLNIFDQSIIESPKKFVYKVANVVYFQKKNGSVELDCGLSGDKSVNWFRPPQYHIYTGPKYKINKIDIYSYGTYYCSKGEINKSSVEVTKIILVKDMINKKEKPIDEEASYIETVYAPSKNIRYRSPNIISNGDTVSWEHPPGTILLDYCRDFYVKPKYENLTTVYYRINRYGYPSINKIGKLFISIKRSDDTAMDVPTPLKYGSEMKIDCVTLDSDNGEKFEVIWKKDDAVIHTGNTLTISSFKKEFFGKYSCEIIRGDQERQIRFVNLWPQQKMETKIEMTPDPGQYYLYHSGVRKELHCEILRMDNKWIMKGSDIIWTFNDRKMDVKEKIYKGKLARLDTNSVSILVIQNMSEENEGTYKCYQNSEIFAAKLLQERSGVLIEIAPPLQELADNLNQIAELHCRIDTVNINSSSITWKFIPENSKTEIELPTEAKVEKPPMASSTSFVVIENVLKRHEGTYVCKVLDSKVSARIVVRTKAVLKVSPKSVTVKPGGGARFVCELSGIQGKVLWRRMDKKSLTLFKEKRFDSEMLSLLEIKDATKNDDGTVYECVFNKLIEYVTLYVKDECPLNQRKCKNETCIDENKFCDGKNDCGDNSDEDRKKCNECSPNSIHCDFLKDANPNKRCVIKHWQCDGVDDCGNNFDELNCPVKNKDKCIGTHYLCNNNILIPRSYWCDGEPDCASMDDEDDCSSPQTIEPMKFTPISIFTNSTLILTCKMSGRPVPTISWRYNWDHLPENLDYNITTSVSNCSVITSTLTVNNINTDHSGIYSCEGISRRRIIAPDFSVSVTKGQICQRPFYNNDAWYPQMCIRCYCSNLTDECTSATGYATNPIPIESGIKPSDAAIVNFKTTEYYKPAREITFANKEKMKYFINETYYNTLVPDPDYYFGGAFNMGGSWLTRYGYPLTYKLVLSGENTDYLPGPLVVIKGVSDSIYHCGVKYRLPVYVSNEVFENNMRIYLWEQDNWFTDHRCNIAATRKDFINVLKNVRLILFKVKYYSGQINFQMSKISMQEAIETQNSYSWVAKLEKCKCPEGYFGLSCEVI